jgi:hypothetical protein
MTLGVCPKPYTGLMPTQSAYAGFSILFFNLLKFTEVYLISLALVLAALVALFAGSLPILALAIAGLAIKIYPIAALAVFAAVTAWAVNQFWR